MKSFAVTPYLRLLFLVGAFLLSISLSATLAPSHAEAAFGAFSTITIDHTKVPNTDQANFPVLISGTYSYLRTVGNGGSVTNANGYDIGFYTNSNCSTGKMAWETETYTASSGLVNYWVKVSSLSHTADTVFYLCYGDATISTDQSAKTSVWDSDYLAVYHVPDGTTLTTLDSTSNSANATNHSATATAGQVGGACLLNGSTQYFETPNLTEPNSITLEAWVKPNAAGGIVFDEEGQVGAWHDSQLEVETNNTVKMCVWVGSPGCIIHSTSITYGTWYQMVMRYNVTGTVLTGFINGVQGSNSTLTKQYPGATAYYGLGLADVTNAGNGSFFSGAIDEVRISDIARPNDWIVTEYNNESSPSTFYSITGSVGRIIRLSGHIRIRGGTRLR